MFLNQFEDILSKKKNNKTWKIFSLMAEFIKTRNSNQCRSHHKRLQRNHQTIADLINEEKSKYSNYEYNLKKKKKNL